VARHESATVEQAADWEAQWQRLGDADDELDAERHGLRWRVQRDLIEQRYGDIKGLDVIEVGAGRSTNALLYALAGATATVIDISPKALELSRERFAEHGLAVHTIEADVFDLPDELRSSFDVSMSFGLCEHFLGERRSGVVAAPLELLRPRGGALINVPRRSTAPGWGSPRPAGPGRSAPRCRSRPGSSSGSGVRAAACR
jgi:2-polyprenyl-3-methyl-5-hydroxy-6-metoxy-1,4-benzoquinol methylase